ncbi:Sec-independent protein translocase TatB [uncultured Amnibacterium sp.]|uniref:Sec-independent protein translocase TatB n=1 Tax=uncultured Amnibacterium sp. TaxID=1631851 RepID=UPI0035CAE0A2
MLDPGKLLVIGVIALFLLGPEKLPQYAAQLAKWVRVARRMLDDAKGRVTSELGPEFDDVDWATLDPRRYHPRRLIADAWNSSADAPVPVRAGGGPSAIDAAAIDAAEPDLLELAEARALAEQPRRTAPAAHYDLGS